LFKSLEYNGVFWHPREEEKWNNPFMSFTEAKHKDDDRKELVKHRNFDFYEIWSDDDLSVSLRELYAIIKEKNEINSKR